MSTEFAIFTDEGAIEAGFYSYGEADLARLARYPDEEAHAGEVCQDHPEQEQVTCEECNASDPDDEEEEDGPGFHDGLPEDAGGTL